MKPEVQGSRPKYSTGDEHPRLVSPPGYSTEAREDPESVVIDIRSFFGLLRRQAWTIVGTITVVVGIALIIATQLDPRYTATTLVVVDSRDAQALGLDPIVTGTAALNTLVDTEVEIVRSSRVLLRAAAKLDLPNDPEFLDSRSLWRRVGDLAGLTADGEATGEVDRSGQPPDAHRAALVEAFGETLRISRRGLTSVIAISASAGDPEAAAQRANVVAEAYLEEQIEAKLGTTQRAAAFLRTRVDELAQSIREVEARIDDFVVTRAAELGTPEARAALSDLRERLTGMEARREATLAAIAGIEAALADGAVDQLSGMLDGEAARTLLAERDVVAQQVAALERSDAERAQIVRRDLAALDRELTALAEQRVIEMRIDASSAEQRETALREELRARISSQNLPNDIVVELYGLQRDAEARRDLYDTYLRQLRQVEQQADVTLPDSRVIAHAIPPRDPSFPPTMLIVATSFLAAIGLGLGLGFVREHYIDGFSDIGPLEAATGVPTIAMVPAYRAGEGTSPDRAIIDEPLSSFSESIRRMRLGAEVVARGIPTCLFVTSSAPREGKSTLALSLGRTFAMTGRRTLLIDADMRDPSIHQFLGRTAQSGLIDFLAGDTAPEAIERLWLRETSSGLHVMLGSDASRVATDILLMSDRFAELVKVARANFDVLIFDTPPVGPVVDAQVIAQHCDAGLYVVRWASTNRRDVRAGLRALSDVDVPIATVLNQAAKGAMYGYGGKYGYYYR